MTTAFQYLFNQVSSVFLDRYDRQQFANPELLHDLSPAEFRQVVDGVTPVIETGLLLFGGTGVALAGRGAYLGLRTLSPTAQFGNNANQVSHAFRHTDKVGLSRSSVQSAISRDLSQNGHLLRAGSNTRTVNVGGTNLTFNAHRLPNGTVNVGRITLPRQ